MSKFICVFCSSSDAVEDCHFHAAKVLGRRIAEGGYGLIYGGTDTGLMGALARTAKECGGRVVGILPEAFREKEIAQEDIDELLYTPDMRARKAAMESRADAFIALPGGFGTLEEIAEILTLRQLRFHQKPVVFLNVNGFYDPLIAFFERFYEAHFAKPQLRKTYFVATTPEEAINFIQSYDPPTLEEKWFRS